LVVLVPIRELVDFTKAQDQQTLERKEKRKSNAAWQESKTPWLKLTEAKQLLTVEAFNKGVAAGKVELKHFLEVCCLYCLSASFFLLFDGFYFCASCLFCLFLAVHVNSVAPCYNPSHPTVTTRQEIFAKQVLSPATGNPTTSRSRLSWMAGSTASGSPW
jgi:hypothetical protein